MVNLSNNCSIKWLEPSPLWGEHSRWIRLPDQALVATPMILRFGNDQFMDELLAMINQCPWRLSEWEAQPETWRKPMPSPNPIYKTRPNPAHEKAYNGSKLILSKPTSIHKNADACGIHFPQAKKSTSQNEPPIKLYQASQNRYYLVAASLVSEGKGYPDYNLDFSTDERATFVVRALVPNKENKGEDEYAFVATPSGNGWKKVALFTAPYGPTQKLIQGEEQLPLFPLNYPDKCGHHRQVLSGLIPVGKREEWLAASKYSGEAKAGMINPVQSVEGGVTHLKDIFYADVIEPWRAMIDQARQLKVSLNTDKNTFPSFSDDWNATEAKNDKARALKSVRDQIQTGSWYILLDFANFIETHLHHVWESITVDEASTNISESEKNFIKLLKDTTLSIHHFTIIAIENLIVAKNSISEDSLWEELKIIWKLEDKLDFTAWPDTIESIPSYVHDRIEGANFTSDDRILFGRILTIIQAGTWFTLMDMLVYLNKNIPNLKRYALDEITQNSLSADEIIGKNKLVSVKKADFNPSDPNSLLQVIGVDDLSHDRMTIKHSLLDAMISAKSNEKALESITFQFDRSNPVDELKSPVIDGQWPKFLFPLADPDSDLDTETFAVAPAIALSNTTLNGMELITAKLDILADILDTLVPKPDTVPERDIDMDFQPLLSQQEAKFVIHCVFERPNCGTLFPALVSKPTRQIELAPFFDPDAPSRAVRIPLPMDISPAGLRKYKKNAMFLISDMLCGKIKKIKKLTLADLVLSVLPWPFHKDLPNMGPTGPCKSGSNTIGMFCSLSIPIVTLCALILMIIMVQLFDVVFRWIPYLFVCLPIPGFKGKK